MRAPAAWRTPRRGDRSPRRGGWRAAAGLGLALLLVAGGADAQQRQEQRREGQREAPAAERPEARAPGEALVERFAARVGQALGLERAERERLVTELQRSRRERAALAQRRRELLRELSGMIAADAPGQGRVERLFRELLELRVRQAEVDLEEDRRLADFLTPLQRARLFHLKQRLAERALDRGRRDRRP